MNSFATNALCAQKALCEKKSIRKAVDKMGQALEASESRNRKEASDGNESQNKPKRW